MQLYIKPKKKEEVLSTLKSLGEGLLKDIEQGKNPSIDVPTRVCYCCYKKANCI